MSTLSPLASPLLTWYRSAGRRELPWQSERTPYRVWVSEVMLQQTQVQTVIPYYLRFMARFPDVGSLAAAPLDEVLHLWSGLGYYARARNLHRAACVIRDTHGAQFPRTFAAVAALPGIGRSTAGAILALACGQAQAILDANARRVLARYFAIGGAPADRAALQQLWERAQQCTPQEHVADYTQAIMDLGATVCTAHRPRCDACPLAPDCQAQRSGAQQLYPGARRARPRPRREVFMLVALTEGGEVLLERRPSEGIWGGLWCPPEFGSAGAAAVFARDGLATPATPLALPVLEHGFTHFDLSIRPLLVRCRRGNASGQGGASLWYNIRSPARIGLPAPVTGLLADVRQQHRPGDANH